MGTSDRIDPASVVRRLSIRDERAEERTGVARAGAGDAPAGCRRCEERGAEPGELDAYDRSASGPSLGEIEHDATEHRLQAVGQVAQLPGIERSERRRGVQGRVPRIPFLQYEPIHGF